MGKEEKQTKVETLSIIIPIYNEEKTICHLIEKVRKADIGGLKKDIILVDDGSSDGTSDILRKVNNAKVFFHETNKGKGAAVRTGLQHAKGDIILIQDADLEYDPNDYKVLLEPILTKKADVVYGSRFAGGKILQKNMYYAHYAGNMFLTSLTNFLYTANLSDMETCYKVMKKEVLNGVELHSMRYDIEPEITAKILKKGISIHEVPINFVARSFEEGKKINWKDGVIALWTLLKYRVKD